MRFPAGASFLHSKCWLPVPEGPTLDCNCVAAQSSHRDPAGSCTDRARGGAPGLVDITPKTLTNAHTALSTCILHAPAWCGDMMPTSALRPMGGAGRQAKALPG